MPPSSGKNKTPNDPIPTHAEYTAFSNQITLLQNRRASLLKSLLRSSDSKAEPTSSSPTPTQNSALRIRAGDEKKSHINDDGNNDDDDDLTKPSRPNEGVGYVAPSKVTDTKRKEHELLRKTFRMKEEDRKKDRRVRRKMDESDSDEEEGRSKIGKGKKDKKRKLLPQEEEGEGIALAASQGEADFHNSSIDAGGDITEIYDRGKGIEGEGRAAGSETGRSMRKKKRKKNKKKTA